ncbi:MAG: hypothetical protein HRT88_11505 [Lentisphaeraceae bacterium]|nr:hypothetical protein [Lentisphaeraceae bacterium]
MTEKYDPEKRYVGPQGNKLLCSIIPPYPPGLPILKDPYNKGGWRHDGAYTGSRRSGFWGFIQDMLERRAIDLEFYADLKAPAKLIEDKQQRVYALKCAKLYFKGVRYLGWSFFRTDKK